MSQEEWERRVQRLEGEGLTRSDAQAVVDAEGEKQGGKMRMSHTPGPWTISPEGWILGKQDSEHQKQVAIIPMTRDGDENSNARLIAACPTMYEYIKHRAAEGDKVAQQLVEKVNA